MKVAEEKSTESAQQEQQPSVRRKRPSRFSIRLLTQWKRLSLPLKDSRLIVAVSGGADSVALLLALDELLRAKRLAVSLTVAHLDHGLRASSVEDSLWVRDLARQLGHEFELERARVRERAGKAQDNLEQAARRARYEFLARAGRDNGAKIVLTAHTMDDQAETVLLRLLRGSGAEGLGGMEPVRGLGEAPDVLLARPLLNWARRAQTEEYCRERQVDFRTDEMNEDEAFARVRVRLRLLPLMQSSFNGRVVEALARTAELLREDARALNSLAAQLLEEARAASANGKCGLSVKVLKGAPASLRRRALRLWLIEGRGDLRRLEMAHLLAVERLLSGERGGRVAELPGGATVTRSKGYLFFHGKGVENEGERD